MYLIHTARVPRIPDDKEANWIDEWYLSQYLRSCISLGRVGRLSNPFASDVDYSKTSHPQVDSTDHDADITEQKVQNKLIKHNSLPLVVVLGLHARVRLNRRVVD